MVREAPWTELGPDRITIDVHHHALVPEYRDQLDEWGIDAQPGVPFPAWSPVDSLAWMDGTGVSRAIVSIGSPGFYFGDVVATSMLTRSCNDGLARLRDRWPDRFGLFATIPLPDLTASLAEAERALTIADFDGVGLLTQYGGCLLGSTHWHELYALLDFTQALVHVHPTVPARWVAGNSLRPSVIDYPFETTRAIVELARNRVFSRYPGIRWIFSHGGGTFGVLADRMSGSDPAAPILAGDSVQDVLRNSRFDSALVGSAGLAALEIAAGAERIVYGSDLPFVTLERIARNRAVLRDLL